MNDNPLVLTFDIGTQSTRGLLVDKLGNIVDYAQIKYIEPYFSIKPDFIEQKPLFYYNALIDVSNMLYNNNPDNYKRIIAVTITTIRDTVLCLDEHNEPLRDIIIWLDKREADASKLPKIPPLKQALFTLAGVKDTIDMQQRQSACNYIMTEEKNIWEKTKKFVLLPTYINYLLTGEIKDSIANQIGHIPFDYKNNKWMKKNGLTRCLFDVPLEKLCDLVKPGEIIGYIKDDVSRLSNIPKGLPLIATGSDKGCETLGLSVIDKTKASVSFGTTATVQFATDKYFSPMPNVPAYPAVIYGYYNPEIQIYRGFWMLSWYIKEFAKEESEIAKAEGVITEVVLNRYLKDVPCGSDGLVLEPFWSPGVSNPNARGAIIGFKDIHTKKHLYRAIIEGIGYGLYEGLLTMEKRSRQTIKEVFVGGGGSMSDEICQIMSDIFNLPLKRIQTHEACGLGSSIIAFKEMGIYNSYNDAINNMVRVSKVFNPDAKKHEIYYNIYSNVYSKMEKRLYPLNKKLKEVKL